jgi:hypothetical protein
MMVDLSDVDTDPFPFQVLHFLCRALIIAKPQKLQSVENTLVSS